MMIDVRYEMQIISSKLGDPLVTSLFKNGCIPAAIPADSFFHLRVGERRVTTTIALWFYTEDDNKLTCVLENIKLMEDYTIQMFLDAGWNRI